MGHVWAHSHRKLLITRNQAHRSRNNYSLIWRIQETVSHLYRSMFDNTFTFAHRMELPTIKLVEKLQYIIHNGVFFIFLFLFSLTVLQVYYTASTISMPYKIRYYNPDHFHLTSFREEIKK